jgi:hypothetical protein
MENTQSSFQYDEICRIIGHLYLESIQSRKSVESHYKLVVEQLQGELASLRKAMDGQSS